MPIFRIQEKLIFFCHVPKCGGTAVSSYIRARFGSVAFLNEGFFRVNQPWTLTSPQHVSADDLRQLFPAGFFDAMFAIVRHPVSRIISEYLYLRNHRGIIPFDQTFSEWLSTLPGMYASGRFLLDNHLRPMCEIVPESSTIFKLEDGLEKVLEYLDLVSGDQLGPRTIHRAQESQGNSKPFIPCEDDIEFIEKFYARDFDRFGYEKRLR